MNPEIENPHLIYPGDKLTLFWRDGQPALCLTPMRKLSPQVRVLEKQAVPTVQEGLVLPYLQSDRLMAKPPCKVACVRLAPVRVVNISPSKISFTSPVYTARKVGIYRKVAQYQRDEKVMVALRLVAVGELAMTGATLVD